MYFHTLNASVGYTFEVVSTNPWGMLDFYYVDANGNRNDADGSPIDADAAPPNNGFVNSTYAQSGLDDSRIPLVSGHADGLFLTMLGKMSGTDPQACLLYSGNY